MMADLQKLPVVIEENKHLHEITNLQAERIADLKKSNSAKDTTILYTEKQLYTEEVLHASTISEKDMWKHKAKKRWWVIVGETLLLTLVTYTAVTK